jgi:hypothetical protein
MDRDAPFRSTSPARRVGVVAALLATVVITLSIVVLGASTAAAEGWLPGGSTGEQQPVGLARAGSEPAAPNWIDGGPVVPLLVVSTVAMLAGGCGLLWSRCRTAAT